MCLFQLFPILLAQFLPFHFNEKEFNHGLPSYLFRKKRERERGNQAHIPPPSGYFVQLENPDGLFLKKRTRTRRWLCCSCQVKENYQSRENEHLKCNSDGHQKNSKDAEQCQLLYTLSQSLRSAGSSENIDTVKDLLGIDLASRVKSSEVEFGRRHITLSISRSWNTSPIFV
ncbi:hypothetical protein ES332_D05G045900v1 [Gossypium tomentosum]|uniref:Uncharacterized protein n=1 Tax=Gossypium tomentosum TaxID=34277 RepID=A0A5D2KTH1_GOSTO|nr:hypothetical protein ES332_D05G045900v1 [Gossypium tomentosum]